MKTTIKKYLVVIVMMLVTSINYANKNTAVKIVDGKKVRIEFESVKKGHTLSVKDKNGTVIYSQEIENSGTYSKVLDLSKLEKGNYTTELEKDFEIVIKPFTVLDGQVSFDEEKTIFKPVIRTEDNLVLISKLAFDKQPLKIAIYYNDEVIFSETVKDEKNLLKRVYKLSKEEKGDYKVIINSNNRSYIKDFNI
ncbi:DUF3244 domain-containing protein [Polaribacter sp. PL03]|uniref:DUF3244 domain-containing protein n=1 Tax=Polaribacter sp. PL03 TaxID=3088353 RepID=UPI0029CB0489|nr:DUF3244 domain-containing protein [Polaribacter sp. PL03]MDX6745697.1 DUF3244 domain-containing protein [Polaribacter sp. PL03]